MIGYRGSKSYTEAIRKVNEIRVPSKTVAIGESYDFHTRMGDTQATHVYAYSDTTPVKGRHRNYTYMPLAWADGHASAMNNQELSDGKAFPGATSAKQYRLYYWTIHAK